MQCLCIRLRNSQEKWFRQLKTNEDTKLFILSNMQGPILVGLEVRELVQCLYSIDGVIRRTSIPKNAIKYEYH